MERLKNFYKSLQANGIMIPILQDPISKVPSLTYTMTLVSFMNDMVRCSDHSSNLLIITSGLYLGRIGTKIADKVMNKDKKDE